MAVDNTLPGASQGVLAEIFHGNLDESAVAAMAAALADTAPPTGLMFLLGGLGAGKTTFARGFLRQMGVTGPVRSPTYTLIETYDLPTGRVLHLDLYRLVMPEELDDLGLRDEFDSALILIEWPEHGVGVLPAADLAVHLEPVAQQPMHRSMHLHAKTPQGIHWLSACLSRIGVSSP